MRPREAEAQEPEIMHLLRPDERVALGVVATESRLHVTDRRMLVTTPDGSVRLDIPYEGLRRTQFDIEAQRPATMVIGASPTRR